MGQHYPRNTLGVTTWCRKCWKNTMHRVDDRRLGPCLECMAKNVAACEQRKRDEAAAAAAGEQGELFV